MNGYAYFCLALFRLSTARKPTPEKLLRNEVYRVCGPAIIGCMIAVAVVNIPPVARSG